MSGITSCNINDINYLVLGIDDQGFQFDDVLEVPGALKVIVQDASGTANFMRGDTIELVDSVEGVIYSGTILSSKPLKASPDVANTYTEHTITCTDRTYPLTTLPNTQNYENWYAGDIAVDMVVNGALGDEGITVAAGLHHDTTENDFNTGILSGAIGTTSDGGDGCLELAKAGNDLTISEATTADFSTGTLTNVVAASNTLSPSTVSGLAVSTQLSVNAPGSFISYKLWSGSMAVGVSDTFNYTLWVASSSPEIKCSVDLVFSDGTTLLQLTASVDQNNVLIIASNDLSAYAKDQWYTRNISISALSGKTVTAVLLTFAGATPGTYTAYLKDVYLGSQTGNKFFAPSATATNVSPIQVQGYFGYSPALTTSSVVPVYDPTQASRVSTAYSIDVVKLLRSSLVTWNAITPASSNVVLNVSYDGGVTYWSASNNAPLPNLPVGSNLAGLSITLKEGFTSGTNPSLIPNLESVSIALASAPAATKSDIVTTFATQAAWNTGTYTNSVSTVSGDLTAGTTTRNWNDNTISNQTFFNSGSSSQSASSGKYALTVPLDSTGTVTNYAGSRLDFAGSVLDFTLEIDTTNSNTTNFSSELAILYRTTAWVANFNNASYYVLFGQSHIELRKGTNGAVGNSSSLQNVTGSYNTSSYHIKIVVHGSKHQVYLNGSLVIEVDDNTYTTAGGVGLFGRTTGQNPGGGGNATFTFDNLVVTPIISSSWLGPANSISSLGTCGPSVIGWTEVNTANNQSAILVETTVDGGSTYQVCTNGGAIPNLPDGTNVSGKSVRLRVTFTAISDLYMPILRGLVWRVLGQYPGSSGTRSTKPLGIDYVDRANQSGWGNASDSQAWAKTGTGTDAVSTNTLTVTNTTGDVHELLGSRTGTDEEVTVQIKLPASGNAGGPELRYTDSSHYYRLSVSTTSLSIIKQSAGATTLATVAATLSTGVWYWLRFRVTGSVTATLQGKIWADGVLEPDTWTITATD